MEHVYFLKMNKLKNEFMRKISEIIFFSILSMFLIIIFSPNVSAQESPPGSETQLTDLSKQNPGGDSLRIFVNNKVWDMHTLYPPSTEGDANEPSLAKNGNLIFYTGNSYALRSVDGGKHWTYVNPRFNMTDFCCDQDVIYDHKDGLFIWFRVSWDDTRDNYVRISTSKDASSWVSHDFTPTDFNKVWTGNWLDYPQLALSDNYLYVTMDVNPVLSNGDSPLGPLILRIPLDSLANDEQLKYNFYYIPNGYTDLDPVQGATDTMYFGLLDSEDKMKLIEWPENSNAPTKTYERNIPATNIIGKNGDVSCIAPDGTDWCTRSATGFLSGWKIGDKIGFFWLAGNGGKFPYPFVDAATFSVSNMTYVGRPLLWSSEYAWQWAYAYPNARGELGMVAYYGGAHKLYPSFAVGVLDNYSDSFSHWDMHPVMSSTNGPYLNGDWGDYLRVRSYDQYSNLWIAGAWTLQGGASIYDVDPRYIVFGLDKDAKSAGFASIYNGSSSTFSSTSPSTSIPSWIKNNAKWWSQGSVGDGDFVKGIQYLIQHGVIQIPRTSSSGSTQQIPTWVKNTAGWWANGQVGDDEFVKAIQYLISNNIITIS